MNDPKPIQYQVMLTTPRMSCLLHLGLLPADASHEAVSQHLDTGLTDVCTGLRHGRLSHLSNYILNSQAAPAEETTPGQEATKRLLQWTSRLTKAVAPRYAMLAIVALTMVNTIMSSAGLFSDGAFGLPQEQLLRIRVVMDLAGTALWLTGIAAFIAAFYVIRHRVTTERKQLS